VAAVVHASSLARGTPKRPIDFMPFVRAWNAGPKQTPEQMQAVIRAAFRGFSQCRP